MVPALARHIIITEYSCKGKGLCPQEAYRETVAIPKKYSYSDKDI